MQHGDPVLWHVHVYDGSGLHKELPQQRVSHLLVEAANVDRCILNWVIKRVRMNGMITLDKIGN
jgi:hypothetical protein